MTTMRPGLASVLVRSILAGGLRASARRQQVVALPQRLDAVLARRAVKKAGKLAFKPDEPRKLIEDKEMENPFEETRQRLADALERRAVVRDLRKQVLGVEQRANLLHDAGGKFATAETGTPGALAAPARQHSVKLPPAGAPLDLTTAQQALAAMGYKLVPLTEIADGVPTSMVRVTDAAGKSGVLTPDQLRDFVYSHRQRGAGAAQLRARLDRAIERSRRRTTY